MTRIGDETVHGFTTGRKSSIGTSAVQLVATSSHLTKGVQLKTPDTNVGVVYVGKSGVTADAADATEGDGAAATPEPAPKTPWTGQRVLRGTLGGLDESGRVILETDQGTLSLDLGSVDNARLVFDWQAAVRGGGRPRSTGGGRKPRGVKRSK